MLILGLNMFHSDASAAIVQDGRLLFAVAEERLNRIKHYGGVPTLAIKACLDAAGASIADVDHVAIGRNRNANFFQKVEFSLHHPELLNRFIQLRKSKKSMNDLTILLSNKLKVEPSRLRFKEHRVEHHIAHIASAFYASGLDGAAGFSCDGSGDFVTAMFASCRGNKIKVLKRIFVPHSLGAFYTMICDFIGYRQFGDEGKVMGLASYGTETYYETICDVMALTRDGFKLHPEYFLPFGAAGEMKITEEGRVIVPRHYSDRMVELFGQRREPGGEVTRRDMDLAYAAQKRFEDAYLHLLRRLHERFPCDDVVMAGGCTLNSVANGKIFTETPFRRTWIQPAAGDEGLAIGSALYVYHDILRQPRNGYQMRNAYLGPEFSEEQIRAALDQANLSCQKLAMPILLETVAQHLASGKIVGWFQGRMEWGPRALGNRSILAHPGLPGIKDILNARIKHREWFRPFAPSILAERQGDYFERNEPSPFMLHVYKIKPDKRRELCAIDHVDHTGRLQTVAREENPLYYDLIQAFYRRTGIPVVLNTSFNENEPIVCTPEEAIDCFCRTHMDKLAIGPFLVSKSE